MRTSAQAVPSRQFINAQVNPRCCTKDREIGSFHPPTFWILANHSGIDDK